ncbi:MAG: Uncharacterized protein CEN88_395 [Candidatus Berkelbacteria bacterium Licking1014_2]|uniref:Uncharacterized protein n=1 Tax=Candidatus Berkelbacteria bacterium Licking1014_2 TaxID=2017146 RepID=A0A554LU04_9BACT|nr:MAG: Uncharacterized protein CEN88_395 [Candidatus Berkelbacteria bacterium Licking1014_2]
MKRPLKFCLKYFVVAVCLSLIIQPFLWRINVVLAEEQSYEKIDIESLPDDVVEGLERDAAAAEELMATMDRNFGEIDIMLSGGRPRLVFNSVDLAILKSYVAAEQLERVVSSVGVADRETVDTIIQYAFDPGQIEAVLQSPAEKANFIQELEAAEKVDGLPAEAAAALKKIVNLAKANDVGGAVAEFNNLKTIIAEKAGDYWQFRYSGLAQFVTRASLPIDQRVVDVLIYLVTPADRGGAGHERIRVKRIWRDYNSEKKSVSQETAGATNISAHYLGQAIDISEIDLIKCTLVKKRRLGKDKKQKYSTTPIKVAWQSEEGVERAGGIEPPISLNEYIQLTMEESILDLLSELDVDNVEGIEVENMDLSDIFGYVGRAMAEQVFDSPNHSLKGFDFGDTMDNLGRAVLADTLNLPRDSWRGKNIDEVEENLGRLAVEEKLRLPAGSLNGDSPDEIFTNIGRRHMEMQLGLPENSLPTNSVSRAELEKKIGQAAIEDRLDFKRGSFAKDNINEIRTAVGKDRFNLVMKLFATVDEELDLDYGAAKDFYQGKTNATDFKQRVGAKIIEQKINQYKSYVGRDSAGNAKTIQPADASFNLPEGTISAFLDGDGGIYPALGRHILNQRLFSSEQDRQMLTNWLSDPSNTFDMTTASKKLGLGLNDFYNIFKGGNAKQTFRQLGKKRLVKAVQQTDFYQKERDEQEEALFAEHPELYELKQQVDFTKNKITDINQRLARLEAINNRPEVKNSVITIKHELALIQNRPTVEVIKASSRTISDELNRLERI